MMRICVAVIFELHVTMSGEERHVDNSEYQIVNRIKSILKGKTPEEQTRIMELVQLGNDDVKLINAMKSGSIALYFHCTSLKGLEHLHHLMDNGRLKTIIEAAFKEILIYCDADTLTTTEEEFEDALDEILQPADETGVFMIQWPKNAFNKCKTFFKGRPELKIYYKSL